MHASVWRASSAANRSTSGSRSKGLTTPKVIVAVHADRGTVGEFDFDMMNKEMSPDRPFFVNEAELAAVVDRA